MTRSVPISGSDLAHELTSEPQFPQGAANSARHKDKEERDIHWEKIVGHTRNSRPIALSKGRSFALGRHGLPTRALALGCSLWLSNSALGAPVEEIDPNNEAGRFHKEGEDALKMGSYPEAREKFTSSLAILVNDPRREILMHRARWGLTQAHLGLHDVCAAKSEVQILLSVDELPEAITVYDAVRWAEAQIEVKKCEPSSPRPRRPLRLWGIGVAGFGGLSFTVMIGMLGGGANLEKKFQNPDSNRADVRHKGFLYNDIAAAAGIIGGIATIAAVALIAIDERRHRRTNLAAAPLLNRGTAGLTLHLAF